LLENHALFRASLAHFLASEPDFEVAGECGAPEEALEMLQCRAVDVVAFDFDIGAAPAAALLSAARAAGFPGRFLAVSACADADTAALALQLGVSGIFLKSDSPGRLVSAIRMVAAGGVWVDAKVVLLLAGRCAHSPAPAVAPASRVLGDRERRVLGGVMGGRTNRDIATEMGVTEGSVKNILDRLFFKAGVRKRSQLVRLALEGSLGEISQAPRSSNRTANLSIASNTTEPRQ
jgi:DNA-binding NarL/FixJ family response regulator